MVYKDKIVGLQRLDMFVAGEVVVELKVAQHIEPIHLAQLLSYVRVAGKEVGLLFRFGGPEPEFARCVLTIRSWEQSIHFHEMRLRGLAVKPHRSMEVFLHEVSIGTLNFAHLQVEDQLLVFPVAILDIANIRQENLKAWMRTLNVPLGILANFHATRLKPVILRA